MSYKPFGEREAIDNYGNTLTQAPQTKRGFTGHEHIKDTPFIDMNARLYDPTLGRFMSADTLIPVPTDSQAYNRYSYVKNNPLKYTDPTGHSWLSKLWKKIKSFVKTIITIIVVAVVATFTVGTLLNGGG